MGTYLRGVLVPNVHQVLEEIQADKENDVSSEMNRKVISSIMNWELEGKGPSRLRPTKVLRMLFLPIAGANYGIPLLAAILSVSTFLILTFNSSRTISIVEYILIFVDTAALVYSAYWGYQAERLR
jgi:hypothetical protein